MEAENKKETSEVSGVIEGDRRMGIFSLWPCTRWHQFGGLGCLRRCFLEEGNTQSERMLFSFFLSLALCHVGS